MTAFGLAKEVIQVIRYLLRAFTRRLRAAPAEPVSHAELPHAHWDRSARRWVVHGRGDDGALPRAA